MRDDDNKRRLYSMRALDFPVHALERMDVRIDGRVHFARLCNEDDEVGSFDAQLDSNGFECGQTRIGLAGSLSLLNAARVQNRHRTAVARVVVPTASSGLGRDVTELGHLCAEKGIDE